MSIAWDALSVLLRESLQKFSDEDCYLIANDIQERSISHQLGCYLQQSVSAYAKTANEEVPNSIPKLKVDCEYNGYEPDQRKWVPWDYAIEGEEELYYTPLPDIITHVRGPKGPNLMVIEIKKEQCVDPLTRLIDKMKLIAYLRPPLRYSFGVFLSLDEQDDDLVVAEAKLVCQAAIENIDFDKINKIWVPANDIILKAIGQGGKVSFNNYVSIQYAAQLNALAEDLENCCSFSDVAQQLQPD